eukprot:gnl/TRDRNA2_/TRDRNA2_166763_c0_seq6.p1 gnl/TRDRNA2_/TRDRNA2_166763_c0~~gnl/TRDRNA2_/TRDRNA2_166763_c0_seq6.p1  ORF type:complete len:527 (+),score=79.38 gnl/TRDRNA2_/TRDRNA2_166763_c0_seq6:91-1671(+)
MDPAENMTIVAEEWDAAMPSLQEFIRVPNLSVNHDPEWQTNGLLDKVTKVVADWIEKQNITGLTCEILKDTIKDKDGNDKGLSPFLFVEIPGTAGSPKAKETFLMYGHLDKMPHGAGWDEDIDPVGGLIRDGKLYGRGAADDGYAVFGCVIAVKALQRQGIDHPRMVILGECCEESGSPHLGHYVEKLLPRIGEPSTVFCLDSGCEDYDTLWMTTSLRGVVMGTLEVSVLTQGMHSGTGGGIVPDAFRVARQLLARVEDPATGKIILPELRTKVPVVRQEQMKALADKFGRPDIAKKIAFQPGAHPQDTEDVLGLYKAGTWEPSLAVVGWDGLPPPERAGNILNPKVKLSLSFRIPPLVDNVAAGNAVQKAFTTNVPCGAKVVADFAGHSAAGWNAPETKPNLEAAMTKTCSTYFEGQEVGYVGLGGTIPLMEMLRQMFPEASLLCTGILGPGTNMHGPNEHLPIEYTKKFTACVAMIMGIIEPPESEWPADVPVPPEGARRKPKKERKFCFAQPDVPIGQCLCCL